MIESTNASELTRKECRVKADEFAAIAAKARSNSDHAWEARCLAAGTMYATMALDPDRKSGPKKWN